MDFNLSRNDKDENRCGKLPSWMENCIEGLRSHTRIQKNSCVSRTTEQQDTPLSQSGREAAKWDGRDVYAH